MRPHRSLTIVALTTALAVALVAPAASADEAGDATPAPGLAVTSSLVSEQAGVVRITGAAPGASVLLSGPGVELSAVADATGGADFSVVAWQPFPITVTSDALTLEATVPVAPLYPDVRVEPLPQGVIADPAALGEGPNPAILPISPERQASMTGLSWRPGCLPFPLLREIQVNYIGPDGYRYRGVLIARANAAERVVETMSGLYDLQYRIWSMHPVDVYGPSPIGTGANDYASMATGNTSMFNCRYVVGRERERRVSPHSTGRSIDINPWENPYRSPRGTYPNTTFLPGPSRPLSPLVLTPNSPAVLLMKSLGWSWLGPRGDYQHFNLVRRP